MNRFSAVLIGGAALSLAGCSTDPAGPPQFTECSTSATPGSALNVAVGGVRVLASAQSIGCVIVPSSGAEYLFTVSNASPTLDDEKRFSFTARPEPAAPAATTNLVTSAALAAGGTDGSAAVAWRELALRRYEREHLDPHGVLANVAAERARLAGTSSSPTVRGAVVADPVPSVGQTMEFRVPGETNPCDSYDSLTAVVKYVSRRAIVVQDVSAPANGFLDADFQSIATEYDNLIFETDSAYFGPPTDIDQNGGHIFILFTPLINKLTPKGSTGITAGFFFAGDFYPRTGPSGQACKQSNRREIFYLLAPDPAGQFGDVRTTTRVRQLTRGTVAHEFQHMINAGIRFNTSGAEFEDVWLDEGLAHFAEEAVGRAARGFGDLQSLSYADVSAATDDYQAFFDQNLRRFALWLQHPDTSSAVSARADENLSSRGAAWALVRYVSEKYSGTDVRAFTRRLVAGPQTGLTNLSARAGVPFDSILVGWVVANYADNLAITGLDPRYSYTSWNMRDAVARANNPGATNPSYPLLINAIASAGGTVTNESRTASATYIRYTSEASATPTIGRLLAESQTALALYPGARLYVLRVK